MLTQGAAAGAAWCPGTGSAFGVTVQCSGPQHDLLPALRARARRGRTGTPRPPPAAASRPAARPSGRCPCSTGSRRWPSAHSPGRSTRRRAPRCPGRSRPASVKPSSQPAGMPVSPSTSRCTRVRWIRSPAAAPAGRPTCRRRRTNQLAARRRPPIVCGAAIGGRRPPTPPRSPTPSSLAGRGCELASRAHRRLRRPAAGGRAGPRSTRASPGPARPGDRSVSRLKRRRSSGRCQGSVPVPRR